MKRKLGTFSPELKRDTIERHFDAMRIYGFEEVQYDFLSAGGVEMPEKIDPALVRRIRAAADARGIRIRAVNGTFNMIHPDKAMVDTGVAGFREIAAACEGLGCGIVTLCTGTRNTQSMWRPHPDNETPEAWDDLIQTALRLRNIADEFGLTLGVEIEASNVINTAEKAVRLLDAMQGDCFGIIMDPANLFHAGKAKPENAVAILEHAFELVKDRIILAHAKDIHAGDGISFTSAGRGIVAFERYFELLDSIGYDGPVIAHGIHDEGEFAYSVAFLNTLMNP